MAEGLRPYEKDFGTAVMTVRVVRNRRMEPLLRGVRRKSRRVGKHAFLIIEIDGEYYVNSLASEDKKQGSISDQEWLDLKYDAALSALKYEANLICLTLNLTRPGSISADEGYSFVSGKRFGSTQPFYADDLYEAVTASEKFGWPTLINLDFRRTWHWLIKSDVLADGVGVNRLGRAIAALSHLTSSNLSATSSLNLVWILLGLESLYSTGSVGMKEQLLGKSEALLGPRKENKKAFGAVYDFRSRLLHGDIDIPLRFSEYDAVKKYEDFHSELYRHEGLAMAALIATLQSLAQRDVNYINFKYEINADS